MPKTHFTPRSELICGKIDEAVDVARALQSVELVELLADIQHDAERMEQKLISRKDEAERREPPADLSLDAMKALKRLEDGKIYDDYDDEDIEENAKAIETIRQALKGRISGVSKEGEE